MINATISEAPISYVELENAPEFTCFVGHCPGKFPEPMPLGNGRYLYLYHKLGLRAARVEQKKRFLTTLEYRYWYQATRDRDASWIVRYEYLREPPPRYQYAPAHVHVNARPASYTGDIPFADLHLPTGGRVTIEALVRHLVAEHDVSPISPNWQQAVEAGEKHWREILRKRFGA